MGAHVDYLFVIALLWMVEMVWGTGCPSEPIVITNGTTCAVDVLWHNSSGELQPPVLVPLGQTVTITSGGCDFNITVELDTGWLATNTTPCGEGVCGTITPYECICPSWTTGAYCCDISGANTTTDTGSCTNNGTCSSGAQCDCPIGFAPPWCCPTGSVDVTCSGSGCCMADGTCLCDDGFSGDDCGTQTTDNIYVFPRASSTLSTTSIALVATAAAVVIIAALVVAATTTTAATTATATATVGTIAMTSGTNVVSAPAVGFTGTSSQVRGYSTLAFDRALM